MITRRKLFGFLGGLPIIIGGIIKLPSRVKKKPMTLSDNEIVLYCEIPKDCINNNMITVKMEYDNPTPTITVQKVS